MKKTVVLFIGVLILAGCSSVPLRTMWRLRGFSVRDVAAIDPNELRVRVISPAYLKLGDSFFETGFVDDKGGSATYRFILEIVDRKEEIQGRFRKQAVAITTLRLSPDVVDDFVRLQKNLPGDKHEHGRAHLTVTANFHSLEKEKGLNAFKLSILIKLKAEEDYFTLIDRAKVVPNIKSEQNKESKSEK